MIPYLSKLYTNSIIQIYSELAKKKKKNINKYWRSNPITAFKWSSFSRIQMTFFMSACLIPWWDEYFATTILGRDVFFCKSLNH